MWGLRNRDSPYDVIVLPATPLCVHTLVSPSFRLFFLCSVYCSPSLRHPVSRRRCRLAFYLLFSIRLALTVSLLDGLRPFGSSLAFGLSIYLPSSYSRVSIFRVTRSCLSPRIAVVASFKVTLVYTPQNFRSAFALRVGHLGAVCAFYTSPCFCAVSTDTLQPFYDFRRDPLSVCRRSPFRFELVSNDVRVTTVAIRSQSATPIHSRLGANCIFASSQRSSFRSLSSPGPEYYNCSPFSFIVAFYFVKIIYSINYKVSFCDFINLIFVVL